MVVIVVLVDSGDNSSNDAGCSGGDSNWWL